MLYRYYKVTFSNGFGVYYDEVKYFAFPDEEEPEDYIDRSTQYSYWNPDDDMLDFYDNKYNNPLEMYHLDCVYKIEEITKEEFCAEAE